ncbi:MAG: DUF3311 domain-containing protein [Streptosporangiales bacterium]|jgi:hypothetical protein|nr:DUF3311 domain-containing protein [Streptosporangiales bacterium]
MSESTKHRNAAAAHPVTAAVIVLLLTATIFFTIWIPLYAVETPKIGSWPFFYFYLLAYMPVVAIVLWITMLLQRRLAGREADQ